MDAELGWTSGWAGVLGRCGWSLTQPRSVRQGGSRRTGLCWQTEERRLRRSRPTFKDASGNTGERSEGG